MGIRIPDQSVTRRLIKLFGGPITSTSANVSGENPPVSVDEALNQLEDFVDLAVDVGKRSIGESSTVVDVVKGEIRIVREGPLSKSAIESVLD